MLAEKKNSPKSSKGITSGKDRTNSQSQRGTFIQPKLKIGASNDVFEKEADAVADRIMRLPLSQVTPTGISSHKGKSIQKKCSTCEEEERLQRKPIEINQSIQAKASEGGIRTSAKVSSQIEALKGGGNPISGPALRRMERGFGRDLSHVRIHNDASSAGLNRELNAKAFTVGKDIYFGAGKYQPHSPSGQHLLAHELTHTIQQGAGHSERIQREEEVGLHSNSGLETKDPENFDLYKDDSQGGSISSNNYYYQKIAALYEFNYSIANVERDMLDKGFWDAILSRAWELRPETLPSATNPTETSEIVFLPVSLSDPGNADRSNYRTHCRFRYGYDNISAKPQFTLDILELIPETSPIEDISGFEFDKEIKFRKKWNKAVYDANANGFPESNLQTYLNSHLEVRNPIIIWLQKKIKTFKKSRSGELLEVKELVKVKERNFNGGESTAMILLDLDFAKYQGILNFSMTYTNDAKNVTSQGHDQKDYADFLRESKGAKQASGAEKLGTIKGLEAITDPDEKAFLKTKAVNFFFFETEDKATGEKTATYRDTELDVFIPVSKDPKDSTKTEYNYYTFIFHKPDANNLINITVRKLGKRGDATIGDPSLPSLSRIPGFNENAFDTKGAETPDTLIKWITGRYNAISKAEITAPTVKEIADKTNAIFLAKSGTKQWFNDNYKIEILDAKKAYERLKKSHKYEETDLVGLKAFTAVELQSIELSLQRMSPSLLKMLENIKMVRQVANAKNSTYSGLSLYNFTFNPRTGKITPGSKLQTVAIYDGTFTEFQLFSGGAGGINPSSTKTISHELGHVVSNQKRGDNSFADDSNKVFNQFMIELGLDPVTIYARENAKPDEPEKATEAFPEAFMLFLNDPEWLLNNQFQSYFWMMHLSETGRPPTPKKAGSLIEVWTTVRNTSPGIANLSQAPASFHLWHEFTKQKSAMPDADHLSIFPIILKSFQKIQNRTLRSTDAKDIVKKWLALVKTSKSQPSIVEVEAFFPNLP